MGVFLLLLAAFYQTAVNRQDILLSLQRGEPSTADYEKIFGANPTYRLTDAAGAFLGYAVISEASGYGGKVSVMTIVDGKGTIINFTILKDFETPIYLKKVLDAGLLEEINGSSVQESLDYIDGVSGATMTAEAILVAAQKGANQIAVDQFGLEGSNRIDKIAINWKQGLAVLVLALGMIGCQFSLRKFRPWLMVASVIVIGFVLNYFISFSQYILMLSGQWPVWIERPLWYLFVPGILIITLFWGKNFYCGWICPFGAAQEGIYKSFNLFKFCPSTVLRARVRKVRWFMLWIVAMTALLFMQPGIAGYEPFSTFFDSTGTKAQWIILAIVVLVSMALPRFWCHDFCPVGLVLNTTAHIRKGIKQRFFSQVNHLPVVQDSICLREQHDCHNSQAAFTRQDTIYLAAAVAVNILILVSLLENLGIH